MKVSFMMTNDTTKIDKQNKFKLGSNTKALFPKTLPLQTKPHLLISINQVMLNHTLDYTIGLLRCRLYIFIVFKSINLHLHHIKKHWKYVFER